MCTLLKNAYSRSKFALCNAGSGWVSQHIFKPQHDPATLSDEDAVKASEASEQQPLLEESVEGLPEQLRAWVQENHAALSGHKGRGRKLLFFILMNCNRRTTMKCFLAGVAYIVLRYEKLHLEIYLSTPKSTKKHLVGIRTFLLL